MIVDRRERRRAARLERRVIFDETLRRGHRPRGVLGRARVELRGEIVARHDCQNHDGDDRAGDEEEKQLVIETPADFRE